MKKVLLLLFISLQMYSQRTNNFSLGKLGWAVSSDPNRSETAQTSLSACAGGSTNNVSMSSFKCGAINTASKQIYIDLLTGGSDITDFTFDNNPGDRFIQFIMNKCKNYDEMHVFLSVEKCYNGLSYRYLWNVPPKGDYSSNGVMLFKDKYNTDDWISQGVTVVYY